MTTREAVLRALSKRSHPPLELNYELVDQTSDVMDIISREREDVELLKHTLREGRENNNISAAAAMGGGGGLKLRQQHCAEVSRLPNPGGGGFLKFREPTQAESSSTTAVTHKPRLIHAVFFISFLILVATSLFTLFDSMTVVEIAYKVHALAGIVSHNREPNRKEQAMRWKGSGFLADDTHENATRKSSEGSPEDSFKQSTKSRMPIPVIPFPAASNATVLSRRRDPDSRCRDFNSTSSVQILGLPEPETDDIIRVTAGLVYKIHLVSFDSFGQRRCAGGDYFETDLRSLVWKSRPPVLDLSNGSYEVNLYVDPRFSGRKFIFKVTLLFSNFDGLRQLDPLLSNQQYRKYFLDKVVSSLEIEFLLPEKAPAHRTPGQDWTADPVSQEAPLATAPGALKLSICKGEDFSSTQWSGRWTRGTFNPNCSMDSSRKGSWRFQCLDPETKCEFPWCEGDVGRLNSNGWVYSAHCSFRIFSPDEAWQCLDGKWLFWWNDSDDQENIMVRDLLKSVLGLSLPEGRWDGMGRFSNKVFVRPDGTDEHITKDSQKARSLKQQVRMTNMWNANIMSNPDHFQAVVSSYFSKFSSPDTVIMNSGLHDGVPWNHWKELVNVGVQNVTNSWKWIFESVSPGRHPRIVFTTTGAQWLSDFNPQLMEMYTSFALNAYATANLTSDFKIVDGFDHSFSWMGRYKGNHQHFVDLMNVHILLNAICTVD